MKRSVLLLLGVIMLGVILGEYLSRHFSFRHFLGNLVRRGQLEALVGQRGIYDTDVQRAWLAELFADGRYPEDIGPAIATKQKHDVLRRLVASEKINEAAAHAAIGAGEVGDEIDLLRSQFPDEKSWRQALNRSATWSWQLRDDVATSLRARNWIENQIRPHLQPNELEERQYFAAHPAEFEAPLRLRASHLFLAAPDGYPQSIIETKRTFINTLAQRLTTAEPFDQLVGEFSEDEATKKSGGDLNYFAAERMLPEVFAAADKLQVGQISPPVRSRLGFHILRLTERRPSRTLTFEEARPEIVAALGTRKRLTAVTNFAP